MSKLLLPDQQKAVLDILYYREGAEEAWRKFREEHDNAAGKVGLHSMKVYDFMHTLRRAGFSEYDIKDAMKRSVGEEYIIDI